jgi:hypothetical protein
VIIATLVFTDKKFGFVATIFNKALLAFAILMQIARKYLVISTPTACHIFNFNDFHPINPSFAQHLLHDAT